MILLNIFSRPIPIKSEKEAVLDEKQLKLNQRKEKKIYEKKLEYVRNIRIQIALLRMDFEIKKSLKVDNTVNLC